MKNHRALGLQVVNDLCSTRTLQVPVYRKQTREGFGSVVGRDGDTQCADSGLCISLVQEEKVKIKNSKSRKVGRGRCVASVSVLPAIN